MNRVRKEDVKNLVFKGGSVKGIAYLGSLMQLEKEGVDLSKVIRVIGTSAGSITALFVALNLYRKWETLKYEMKKDFTKFLDGWEDRIVNLSKNIITASMTASSVSSEFSSGESLGLVNGDNFRDWIEGIIEEETKITYCTFQELASIKNKEDETRRFKDLYVVAFDLEMGEPLIYSSEKTPDAIISDAIRSSASIPYIFEPHKFYCKNKNGVVRMIPDGREQNNLIDGGIVLNYPVRILDEIANPGEILGLYLTNLKTKSEHSKKYPPLKFKIHNDEDKVFTKNIYKRKTGSIYSIKIYKSYKSQGKEHAKYEKNNDRTIYMNNLNISSLKFNLDDKEKIRLIESGVKAVEDYFQFQSKE